MRESTVTDLLTLINEQNRLWTLLFLSLGLLLLLLCVGAGLEAVREQGIENARHVNIAEVEQ
jgi:hypothetical protein